jgi:ABC-2 type transport system permease protein
MQNATSAEPAGHLNWTLNSHRISLLMVAFLPAMFFYFQAVKLFWRLLAEIQACTIEQVYLSPLPSWLVAAAGRLSAAVIETLILMGVVFGIVSAFVTRHFHWTAALVPMALLMVTGVGYSLIIAAMTLLWKRIQLLQETILMLVMIFAVTALPLISGPGWFTGLGWVFPVTAEVASLYGVMLGHRGVTVAWGTGGLVWVMVTAADHLAAGITVFRSLERVTKARGALAPTDGSRKTSQERKCQAASFSTR